MALILPHTQRMLARLAQLPCQIPRNLFRRTPAQPRVRPNGPSFCPAVGFEESHALNVPMIAMTTRKCVNRQYRHTSCRRQNGSSGKAAPPGSSDRGYSGQEKAAPRHVWRDLRSLRQPGNRLVSGLRGHPRVPWLSVLLSRAVSLSRRCFSPAPELPLHLLTARPARPLVIVRTLGPIQC